MTVGTVAGSKCAWPADSSAFIQLLLPSILFGNGSAARDSAIRLSTCPAAQPRQPIETGEWAMYLGRSPTKGYTFTADGFYTRAALRAGTATGG
jgi:hypothetical protein